MGFPSNSRYLDKYEYVGKWASEGKRWLGGEKDPSQPPGHTVSVQAMDTDLEQGAGIQLTVEVACFAFDRIDRD